MMRLFVVLCLTTFFCISSFGEASKCDENIISKIKEKFWNNGQCIPREILRSGAYMNPGITKRTTKDFTPDEENVSCTYSIYEGPVLKVYTQYINSTTVEETPVVATFIEKEGFLIDQETGSYYVYFLYTDRYGVRVFYTCSPEGELGDPEAKIKVSRGYDEQALAESVEDLASLGIYVSDKIYSESCAP